MAFMFRQSIARFFNNRLFFSFMSIGLLLVAYTSLKTLFFGQDPAKDHYHEAIELWHGYGTLLLGFGVILEEYPALSKIFRRASLQDSYQHILHNYGILFVIIGVVVEMLCWLVKIPNSALDTAGIEMALIYAAALAATVGVFCIFSFLYKLWNISFYLKKFSFKK